jgi:hypothetical protein
MGVMFLHSTAQLKDGRLSRADSRKSAKELNRRQQREFEQKLAKEAKVDKIISMSFAETLTLLPSLTSVQVPLQFLSFAPFCESVHANR